MPTPDYIKMISKLIVWRQLQQVIPEFVDFDTIREQTGRFTTVSKDVGRMSLDELITMHFNKVVRDPVENFMGVL